jgi:hypothetical protein
MTLAQAAAETRIREPYLAAIEAGEFHRLPGAFFTRSFIRQYASFLGVAREQVESELDRIVTKVAPALIPGQEPRRQGSDLPPIAGYAAPGGDRRLWRAVGGLLAVVALCAAAYSWWLRQREVHTAAPGAESAPPVTAPAAAERPSVAEAHPVAAPSAGVETRGPLWLEIVAQEETWIEITSNGQRLYQGVLEPNQSKVLSGLDRARLVVGNAGGLRIVSNGRPIGPIGERGQVRVVMLSPEGAEVLAPRKKPAEDVEENQSEPGTSSLRG